MKNFTKILCVVLALVMALSVASCSFSKQYTYQQDDIEIPIGVYIYYLMNAYNQAQSLAQQSDLYDAETGKYDGKTSFLKMEITDEDDVTAVAEDWIKDKAAELAKTAVAACYKFNELGCTMDEAELETAKTYYESYWDQGYSDSFEPYGISFESFFLLAYTIPVMESEAFTAEYAVDGPSAVSDEELGAYFTENYTSYKYFSANLYTTATETVTDGDGNETEQDADVALSADEIAAYEAAFRGYADALTAGTAYDEVVSDYMTAYDLESDPTTESVEIIDEDTEDEIMQTILGMQDGEAVVKIIGDEDNTKQIYLIYREPITEQLEAYTDPDQNRSTVLSEMKSEAFEELLKDLIEDRGITLSPACNGYKPSMFEE